MPGKRERTRYPGLYRLPSGLFQVVFRTPEGKQRSQSFQRLADARTFQTTVKAELAKGTWIDPAGARVPLAEWVEYWKTQRRVAATTRAKDQSRLTTHILPRFGTMALGRIDPTAVKAWVRDMEAAGLARSTVEGTYQLLAQVMAEAVEADLIARSPCRGIRFDPSRPGVREARVLTTAEAARLLEALREGGRSAKTSRPLQSPGAGRAPALPVPRTTPYTLVLTALGTGLRFGEVTGLRRRDISLLGRPPSLRVVESLHEVQGRPLYWGPPKTSSSRRRVPLPAAVVQALAAHLPANGNPDDVVFPTPQGMPWRRRNFATRVWLPALQKADLEGLHFHDLRHAYNSWLADAGIPEVIRAAVMGHKVGFTQTSGYTSVIAGFEDRVLAALDERLGVVVGGEEGHRIGG